MQGARGTGSDATDVGARRVADNQHVVDVDQAVGPQCTALVGARGVVQEDTVADRVRAARQAGYRVASRLRPSETMAIIQTSFQCNSEGTSLM